MDAILEKHGLCPTRTVKLISIVIYFLAHPNIRLFIFQGGLQSTQEAIYYGVPMLVIPIAFDQHHIAYTLRDKGVGLLIDLNRIYRKLIRTVLNELLTNVR